MKPTTFDLGDARDRALKNKCQIKSFENEDDSYFIGMEKEIIFVCECGNNDTKNFKSFISNPKCFKCSKGNVKHSLAEVSEIFSRECCILKTEEYINTNQKLNFICICSKFCKMSLRDFKLYNMCKECYVTYKNRKRFIRWNIKFNQEGCILLTTECKRTDQNIKYICKCGRESTTQFYRFKNGQKCMKCRDEEYNIGEKHRDWKGGITPENTKIRKSLEYQKWRDSVLHRDNYTCKCCEANTKSLQVHHIDSFADFKELRYILENGITLCFFCHSPKMKGSFHHTYGTHNNSIFELQDYFDDIRSALNLPLLNIEDIIY